MTKFTTISIILFTLLACSALAQTEETSLELQQARTIGKQLHFDFLLTNLTADVDFSISFRNTKLYDGEGNVFDPELIRFAQMEKTYGEAFQNCPEGIPMKLKIVFSGAPSKLAVVKELNFKLIRKSDNKEFPVSLTDVAIPTTDNELVLKAHENPHYFEVEPDVFAELTTVERNDKILRFEFMVVNQGSDKKVAFGFRDTRIIDDKGNTMELKTMNFSGMEKTYGECFKEMPTGIPMKLEYFFELKDPSAQKIMMFEFGKHNNVFQIRDIEI